MARNVEYTLKGLKDLQKELEKFQNSELDEFIEKCAKNLAARLLRGVIKRTPVGVRPEKPSGMSEKEEERYDTYWGGYTGGTLRRGWISGTQEEAEAVGDSSPNAAEIAGYVRSLPIQRIGNTLQIEITNPVEYASYVEYGHRQEPGRYVPAIGKKLKKSWTEGKFMLTLSEREIQKMAPAILEKEIEKKLKEIFK